MLIDGLRKPTRGDRLREIEVVRELSARPSPERQYPPDKSAGARGPTVA
jgi:hypothetical protein